jgi:ribosome-binding protein aMBF1 (putative translation factor)
MPSMSATGSAGLAEPELSPNAPGGADRSSQTATDPKLSGPQAHHQEKVNMKNIGQLLREARQANGLNLEQVASRIGYRNTKKGVHKLMAIEATGVVRDETLVRLVEVLQLDWCEVQDMLLSA